MTRLQHLWRRLWFRPPEPETKVPRGVTVYTLVSAEHYPGADGWLIDDKELAHVHDVDQQSVATFLHGTWLRIEVGAPPEPVISQEAPE